MKVFFSTYAKFELEDAERFYELDRKGLGKKFKADVREAMLKDFGIPGSMARRAPKHQKVPPP